MKIWIYKVFALILGVIFISCKHGSGNLPDYTHLLYSPEYSIGFEIKGDENSDNVMITVSNPWQGADDVTKRLYIQKDSVIANGLNHGVLKNEAKKIACMSSTHIAMLDALGETHRIVAVSGLPFVSNEKIRARGEEIADIGYDGNIDYEALLAAAPDIVLLYSINSESGLQAKLDELNIPYIYIGDYLEENPLGKAEWVVAIAELVNKREKGIQIYNEICNRYNKLKKDIETHNLSKPKVMLNIPYGDSWFMPPTGSYMADLIEAAGGEYIYKENHTTSSLPIDMEEAFELVANADYWINVGTLTSLDDLKKNYPRFKNADCVLAGKVYNNNKILTEGGGNAFFESGIMNPDLILRDLSTIFHPELNMDEELIYYHKL
ncbi:MAG: ABC transporter substrate-binding protein [Muribaculaceae bacterium]|nr:ABC transporter substrate-binding protein [Muribaculaceae bacterium]